MKWLQWLLGLLTTAGLVVVGWFYARKLGKKEEQERYRAVATKVAAELAERDRLNDKRTASLQRLVRSELVERLAREPTEAEVRDLIDKAKEP